MRDLYMLNLSYNHHNLHLFDAKCHIISHQRSGLFVRVWRMYGDQRMYMAQAHVCGTHARVALVHACMCMQDMIRTHVKMKCKEKNGTFEVYYPPAIVWHSYVLVYNLHITVCVCMHSYVTRI